MTTPNGSGPLLIPLLGDLCKTLGAGVCGVCFLAGVPLFPLSWGRGRFGRLRPKSVRGLPGTQLRVTQESPLREGWRESLRCLARDLAKEAL